MDHHAPTSSAAAPLLQSLFPVSRMQLELVSNSWRALPPVQISSTNITTPSSSSASQTTATIPDLQLFVKGVFHLVHGTYVVVSDLKGIVLVGICNSATLARRYESGIGGGGGGGDKNASSPPSLLGGGCDIANLLMQLEDGIKGQQQSGGGAATATTPATTQQSAHGNSPSASAAGGGSSSQHLPVVSCTLVFSPGSSSPFTPNTTTASSSSSSSSRERFYDYVKRDPQRDPTASRVGGAEPEVKLHVMLPARITETVSILRPFIIDLFPLQSLITNPGGMSSSSSSSSSASSYIAQFLYEMVISPMLRAQAALCGALAVLASQGRLSKEDFNEVFQHPVVRQHAQNSSISSLIGNAPTFWPVVASAAFPAPPPEDPLPPHMGVDITASSLVFAPQSVGGGGGLVSVPQSTGRRGAAAGGSIQSSGGAAQQRGSHSLDDSQVRGGGAQQDLIRVAGKKATRNEAASTPPAAAVTPVTTAVVAAPPAVTPPAPVAPPSAVDAKKKLRKALL